MYIVNLLSHVKYWRHVNKATLCVIHAIYNLESLLSNGSSNNLTASLTDVLHHLNAKAISETTEFQQSEYTSVLRLILRWT